MEDKELRYLSTYAHRINDSKGDLAHLSSDERAHLKALIQKFELERKLDEMAEKVGQTRLAL